MLRGLRRIIMRRRFAKMTASFDRRIKQARAKHGRIREIQAEKSAFVHACLRGQRG